MSAIRVIVVTGLIAALLVSCASFRVERVEEGEDPEGIRFYRPHPYVLLTHASTDKEGFAAQADTGQAWKAEIVMLPEKSEEYVVRWTPGAFGNVEPDITLQEGWNLTSLSGSVTSDGANLVASLGGILDGVSGVVGFTAEDAPFKPGLYRMEWGDHGGWEIDRSHPVFILSPAGPASVSERGSFLPVRSVSSR